MSCRHATFHLLTYLCLALLRSSAARAEDPPKFEVHEWSVWVGDAQGNTINPVADFTSAMPGIVETDRSRRKDAAKPGPTPMSLLTLYGEPPEVVDLDLRVSTGRPVAQWPKSESKSNRLRWLDLTVSKAPSKPEALVIVPEGHWFHKARELGGLYLQMKKSTRSERFLTYDLEFQASLTLRVDGGPDQFKIANLGKHPLKDVLLIVPSSDGRRVGWIESIAGVPNAPAGNPPPQQPQPATKDGQAAPQSPETLVDCPLSGVLKSESDEYREKTSGEWRKRLTAAGISAAEIDLLLSLHAGQMFESDAPQIVFRLSPEALEEMAPLSVEPETAKIKRVALVVVRNIDPKLRETIDKLIAELGDNVFSTRERAESRLRELGRLAIPKLKEALKNTDPEIVTRAERLLLAQKEQLPPEAN